MAQERSDRNQDANDREHAAYLDWDIGDGTDEGAVVAALDEALRERAADAERGMDVAEVEATKFFRRWKNSTEAQRHAALQRWAQARFAERFGRPWEPKWRRWAISSDRPGQRAAVARAAIVLLLDWRDVLGLQWRGGEWLGPRFLSVTEYTWIALAIGLRKKIPRRATPLQVVAAEREAMKKALAVHGQKASDLYEPPKAKKFSRRASPHIRRGIR